VRRSAEHVFFVIIVCLSQTRRSSHRLCMMVPLAAGRHFSQRLLVRNLIYQLGDVPQIDCTLRQALGLTVD
jgi:hypothetical protein